MTPSTLYLPPLLTTQEFALCVRHNVDVVRRKIRKRIISAKGRPAMIPPSELAKFGVAKEDAALRLNIAREVGDLPRNEQLRVVRKMEAVVNGASS